jgi:hypothetical protein
MDYQGYLGASAEISTVLDDAAELFKADPTFVGACEPALGDIAGQIDALAGLVGEWTQKPSRIREETGNFAGVDYQHARP